MFFYLISYDIPDTKRRTKISNLLLGYGHRVQMSVFEVWLDTRGKRELLKQLKAITKTEEDSVRLYHLCKLCQKRVEVIGLGQPPVAPGAIVI
jgi:CRISPR-associated protein Cas2